MATTVGWQNKQFWRSDGNVVAEGKGNQGDEKVQKQPREEVVEQ